MTLDFCKSGSSFSGKEKKTTSRQRNKLVKENRTPRPSGSFFFSHKIECHSCMSDVVLIGMLGEERNMTATADVRSKKS